MIRKDRCGRQVQRQGKDHVDGQTQSRHQRQHAPLSSVDLQGGGQPMDDVADLGKAIRRRHQRRSVPARKQHHDDRHRAGRSGRQSQVADGSDVRVPGRAVTEQNGHAGDDQQRVQSNDAVQKHGGHRLRPPSRLLPRQKHRLEKVAAYAAESHEVQQVADKTQAKSVGQPKWQTQCPNEHIPTDERRTDTQRRQGETSAQQRPTNRVLPQLPQLIPVEAADQPHDDGQRQDDFEHSNNVAFLQGEHPVAWTTGAKTRAEFSVRPARRARTLAHPYEAGDEN